MPASDKNSSPYSQMKCQGTVCLKSIVLRAPSFDQQLYKAPDCKASTVSVSRVPSVIRTLDFVRILHGQAIWEMG